MERAEPVRCHRREFYERETSLCHRCRRLTPQEKLCRFEKQISPHLKSAYNLAKGLTRSHEDAEDVVQGAFSAGILSF